MNEITSLSSLLPGETARVLRLFSKDSIRRRLIDLGLIEGACIECAMTAPGGDPTAYRIRGMTIALRSDDAQDILVAKEAVV